MRERIQEMELEEQELQFRQFTNETALEVGLAIIEEAKSRGRALRRKYTARASVYSLMPWKARRRTMRIGFGGRTMW